MSVQEDKETIIKLLGVIGGVHTIKCMSYFKNKQTGTNFHWRYASEHICKVKCAVDHDIEQAAAELLKEGKISKIGSYYWREAMDKSDQIIFNLNRQVDELSSRLARYKANEKDIMSKVGPAVAMLIYCSDELRVAANSLQGMQHKCNTYSTQILNQAHILGLIKSTEPLEADHGCDCGKKDS